MLNYQQTTVAGCLFKAPEFKAFANGNIQVRLELGVTAEWQDRTTGEWQSRTEKFIAVKNCSEAFKGWMEKNLHTGTNVQLVGETRTRSYEQDGVTKYITELHFNNLNKIGDSKKYLESVANGQAPSAQPVAQPAPAAPQPAYQAQPAAPQPTQAAPQQVPNAPFPPPNNAQDFGDDIPW